MANFLKILAASVGGGMVLGAGIRLGEALASREPGSLPDQDEKLADRIGALENRLQGLEEGFEPAPPAAIVSRFDIQEAELAAVRAQMRKENHQIEDLGEAAVRLRGELQGWLENSVTSQMAAVETRLKLEAERSQRQMLDAFVESVQTRVIQRISSLEEEVAGQSAAMSELRACSLRTEQSMQKLLGGLDRIIVQQSVVEEESSAPAAIAGMPVEPAPASLSSTRAEAPTSDSGSPAFTEPGRRRSKWNIFR